MINCKTSEKNKKTKRNAKNMASKRPAKSSTICNRIKGNEFNVANIDFELYTEKGDKFLRFTLFKKSKNCPYLCNWMFDCNGNWTKLYYNYLHK